MKPHFLGGKRYPTGNFRCKLSPRFRKFARFHGNACGFTAVGYVYWLDHTLKKKLLYLEFISCRTVVRLDWQIDIQLP